MRSMIVAVSIACLLSGCVTRRTAGAGAVAGGLTLLVAGGVGIATGGDEASAQRYSGAWLIAGAGATLLVVSLVGLVVGRPTPEEPAAMADTGRACMPVEPGSSVWSCGSGHRCTDDFAGCEPADGRPALRQR